LEVSCLCLLPKKIKRGKFPRRVFWNFRILPFPKDGNFRSDYYYGMRNVVEIFRGGGLRILIRF
jgi:hypothetical protein